MKQILRYLAIIGVIFVGLAFLVWLIDFRHLTGDDSLGFGDSLWYTMVTITTVGYGDIYPKSFGGRFIAICMFVFSVALFSFLLTRIETIVSERGRLKALGMQGTKFTNHVVVCSWSRIALVAIKELLAAGRQVAVVTETADTIPLIQQLGDQRVLFVTVGDPTSEEALARVNLPMATTVVAASDDDTLNLIVAIECGRMQPNARIVVSTKRAELRNTLTASGVTYVASPFELSGRLVASAAFEPEVAKFIEDVTSGADDLSDTVSGDNDPGYDLQQFTLPPNSQLVNQPVGQISATMRQIQGPLIVAIAKHTGGGEYQLFPHPDDNMVLYQHDSLIVLGNTEQNGRVSQMLGVVQGR